MSLPQHPLQSSITRGKRRKRDASLQKMSNKSFLLLVVAALLHLSVAVHGYESFDTAIHSTNGPHRNLEEVETYVKRAKAKKKSSSSSEKAKQSSSSADEKATSKVERPAAKQATIPAAMDTAALQEESSASSFNVTAISMTTCIKIEYAVSYLTSLNWQDIDVQDNKSTWSDMYLLQLIVLPASLSMVFFGSQLLLPVCTMTAAGLGVFCIFHFVDHYFRNGLDCPMKLALSGVSATLAAMGAAAFVRFGLFTLGTVSAGGMSYLFFDAFPDLDPGLNGSMASSGDATARVAEALESDLSPHAWVITILLALAGGLFLRLYEQASLEVLTAILGGVGVSYSAHAFLLIRHVDLDRSVVFLIASAVALLGWRFQRNRRLRMVIGNPYADLRGLKLPVHAPPSAAIHAAPPPAPMVQPMATPVDTNPNLSLNNWNQLQYSLYSTNHLLQQQRKSDSSSNEIEGMAEELTNLLNSFQERIQERERSKRR